jgi:mono/diheme cytochrome c family protein
MKHRPILVTLAILPLLACAACSSFPSAHRPELAIVPPSEVVDFNALYEQNCAGCHGVDGKGGAAFALANPVFLAIADDTVIRRIASDGVPGTPMPAFAKSAGGMLTEKQIDALVNPMLSAIKHRHLISRLLEIRSVAPVHIERTVPRVMEQTVAGEARPARL